MIVGIDEVGRGAWAGPLVVGAVLLGGVEIAGLTDSKKLTKAQREILDLEIRQKARAVGLGWVSAKQIDAIGLTAALKLASQKAVAHIRHDYKEIIIDGNFNFLGDARVTVMKKADLLVPSVSAASIVAKVARDNYMKHLDGIFPNYKFKSHVGYGTAGHRKAILEHGVSSLHRLTYAPLQPYVNRQVNALAPDDETSSPKKTTRRIGDAGEEVAARYLQEMGHRIVARNWRTKYCEVDIISRMGSTVYFTEVKYRKNDAQGGGMAAITAKKQRQMKFAAEFFAAQQQVSSDMRLAVADIFGTPPQLKTFLELG